MNITSLARADQLIPMSRARANLPSLVKELDKMDFFVLVKKYQPQAALVNPNFLTKLINRYREWQRQGDFDELEKMMDSLPAFDSEEVERDIADAVKAVRHAV